MGLLKGPYTYRHDELSRQQLAELARQVEIDLLGEPIGKQDQYLAAFGRVTCLEFSTSGEVTVTPRRCGSLQRTHARALAE